MMILQGLKRLLDTWRRIKQWAARQQAIASCRRSGGHYWEPTILSEDPLDPYELCSRCPASRPSLKLRPNGEDHWCADNPE